MSLADAFTGTRALPALQTSSEVTKARDLLGDDLLFSKLWMHRGYFNKKRMHLSNASTSAGVGFYWQIAIQFDQLTNDIGTV